MGLFEKLGISAFAFLSFASVQAGASTLQPEYIVSFTFTPATGSTDVFAGNDVDVTICSFCVFTGLEPWDLYITDTGGNVVNHLFSPGNDDFDFSAGIPGGADPLIGQPCPDLSLCQVQDPSGLTDVTNLFNSQGISVIGGINGMTVQAIPEPTSLALWGVGILGLWRVRQRRKT
jgi:PEP-CTERM motif